MNYREAHRRVLAAQTLLLEPSTSREKFNSISTLIRGINPKLDDALTLCEEQLATMDKIYHGALIELSLEHLPEFSEEQKRRKRALVVFVNTWNQLKGEVARASAELDAAQHSPDAVQKTSHWGRIFNFAKGPFGLVTVLAVTIAVAAQTAAVRITIHNSGCGTLLPSGSISLPGFSLPKDPILSGGTAVMIIPPLTVQVDGTKRGALVLKAFTFTASFQLPGNILDVTLDDVSLPGKTQSIRLLDKKEHTLTLHCA